MLGPTAMDRFESKVLATIRKHSLLKEGDRVVAAISGGADSVSLLITLRQIAGVLDFSLLAAHANHKLRGDESDEDQRFVGDLCEKLAIPLVSRTIEIETHDGSRNLEDCARQRRYAFLAETAHCKNAVLATGHNKNDQAETFLLKLLRGAGPSGLSGILIKRDQRLNSDSVSVVRPLLEVTREEILEYLESRGQNFREDLTNSQLQYDRNWIRHKLLPTLQDRINPNITETLARNAALFAEIDQYLDEEAAELMERIGTEREGELLIDLSEFNPSPLALRKQLARQAIRRMKGDLLDITQNHVLAFLDLCTGTSGRQIHLPGKVKVSREFGNLRIHGAGKEVEDFEYQLRLPGELHLPEIRKKVLARKVSVRPNQNRALLSARMDRVTVRNRRPGDRFLSSAKSPVKSLKRLFLEKRVPISNRGTLVVFESEGKVVWIEGFPVSPDARAGELDLQGFEIEVVSETFEPSVPSK